MGLYDLNRKMKIARQGGFLSNQVHKLTTKIYLHLRHINKRYYLKLRIPIFHRQFFRIISQNPDCVKNHCNVMKNPISFAISFSHRFRKYYH